MGGGGAEPAWSGIELDGRSRARPRGRLTLIGLGRLDGDAPRADGGVGPTSLGRVADVVGPSRRRREA